MVWSLLKSKPVFNFLIRKGYFLIKLLRLKLRLYCKAAIISSFICYGPYNGSSGTTETRREQVSSQCGTDGPSGSMGRGVAESRG